MVFNIYKSTKLVEGKNKYILQTFVKYDMKNIIKSWKTLSKIELVNVLNDIFWMVYDTAEL